MRRSDHASSDESFPPLVPQNLDLSLELGLNVAVQVTLQLVCREPETDRSLTNQSNGPG